MPPSILRLPWAAPECVQADGTTRFASDGRGIARPQFGLCDIGAFEYAGDYIFAANFEAPL